MSDARQLGGDAEGRQCVLQQLGLFAVAPGVLGHVLGLAGLQQVDGGIVVLGVVLLHHHLHLVVVDDGQLALLGALAGGDVEGRLFLVGLFIGLGLDAQLLVGQVHDLPLAGGLADL